MKRLRRWLLRALLVCAFLAAAEVVLLRHPSGLFFWSVKSEGLTLYADRPFREVEGVAVLSQVQARISESALYRGGRTDRVYICNSWWRRLFLFVGNYRAGGLNYAPLTTNVFLSGADVGANRLISRTGYVVPGDMTLSYFIAHEITHSLTEEAVGAWRYQSAVPSWLKEGYADYVARGSVFSQSAARRAFLEGAPEMNWPAQAPYLRYNLIVGYLMEHEGRSLGELLQEAPTQREAEARLRSHLSAFAPSAN